MSCLKKEKRYVRTHLNNIWLLHPEWQLPKWGFLINNLLLTKNKSTGRVYIYSLCLQSVFVDLHLHQSIGTVSTVIVNKHRIDLFFYISSRNNNASIVCLHIMFYLKQMKNNHWYCWEKSLRIFKQLATPAEVAVTYTTYPYKITEIESTCQINIFPVHYAGTHIVGCCCCWSILLLSTLGPVSYTHLDVYKRQL